MAVKHEPSLRSFVAAGSQVVVGTIATAFLFLGAVPGSSGYSHAASVLAKQESGFVPQTFGIVTQIEGLVYLLNGNFEPAKLGGSVEPIEAGRAILVGHRVWVAEKARLSVVTGRGAALLIEGPSSIVVSEVDRVDALRGVFRVLGSIQIQTPYSTARSEGEYAAWVSDAHAQYVAVRKKTKVWNPFLADAAVELLPGWFTEASTKYKHVQPKRARMVDASRGSAMLAQLDAMWDPNIAQETAALLLSESYKDIKKI